MCQLLANLAAPKAEAVGRVVDHRPLIHRIADPRTNTQRGAGVGTIAEGEELVEVLARIDIGDVGLLEGLLADAKMHGFKTDGHLGDALRRIATKSPG